MTLNNKCLTKINKIIKKKMFKHSNNNYKITIIRCRTKINKIIKKQLFLIPINNLKINKISILNVFFAKLTS